MLFHFGHAELSPQPSRHSTIYHVWEVSRVCLGGGFDFFHVHPDPWGNDPIWRAYFSNGLVQPPTRYVDETPTVLMILGVTYLFYQQVMERLLRRFYQTHDKCRESPTQRHTGGCFKWPEKMTRICELRSRSLTVRPWKVTSPIGN